MIISRQTLFRAFEISVFIALRRKVFVCPAVLNGLDSNAVNMAHILHLLEIYFVCMRMTASIVASQGDPFTIGRLPFNAA